MSVSASEDLNSLIYTSPLAHEPTRYEMVRYSTWRIYLFQEFESLRDEQIQALRGNQSWIDKYPQLTATREEREFYIDLLSELKDARTRREDLISHFVCRMLYCHDTSNHAKFVEMEKLILTIKLERRLTADLKSRVRHMELLKRLLAFFLERKPEDFHVPVEDWVSFANKIVHKKDEVAEEFAVVPLEFGEVGLRKRFCFVRRGNVYMTISCVGELVANLYAAFLKGKLEKMRGPVIEMLNSDSENQMSAFIRRTLESLNTSNFDDSSLAGSQFKLTLKNVDALWKRFFPPCMMHLNARLKQFNHLKHEGRRQLWLFLKGCGMDAHDNKEYFRKHFMSKVSVSDLKSHMYNIDHAYGLVGKKQVERPKNCRNIITGPAPRKDEHHGCPFAHWRKEELHEFLRKHYNISEANLVDVLKEKEENHFQVRIALFRWPAVGSSKECLNHKESR
jgi:DNA primase large subunit